MVRAPGSGRLSRARARRCGAKALDFRAVEYGPQPLVTVSAPQRSDRPQTAAGVADREAAALWHGAWAVMAAVGAAVLLMAQGAVAPRALAALALGAAPGLLGFFHRPVRAQGRAWGLAAWAAASALAAMATGGLSGPLAVWLLSPLLAALAYGGLWREATARAFAGLAAVAVVQAGGRAGAPLEPPFGFALGLIAMATALLGAAAALMMRLAGAAAEPPAPPTMSDTGLAERLAAAERARDDAQSDARGKMQFLANMSHELRTPLNAIMGFSDMMRARVFGELPPRYAEYAELIHEGGAHLLDLINDVLDASKLDADKYELSREVFDAREAVSASLRIVRKQADDAGVHLRGVLPAEPLEVDADRRAIKQIVLNLVSNALKFTPAGGSVSVGLAAAGQALEIAVSDTGVGIAPEDLARLGRPYEQAGDVADRTRGTGLGLSLVKAFARLHGGDMALESRLGEGTAVTVRLPVLVSPQAADATGAAVEGAQA